METKPTHTFSLLKFSKRIIKFSLFTALISALLLVLLWGGLHFYLESEKTKILDDLGFLNQGSITFEETSVSLFKNFPSATLSMHHFTVRDAQYQEHEQFTIVIEELSTSLSLHELWDYSKIEIQSLTLHNGHINLFTDSLGFSNVKSLFPPKDSPIQTDTSGLKFNINNLTVDLENIRIELSNALKNTLIKGHINSTRTQLSVVKDTVVAHVNMNAQMDKLILGNIEDSYIENTRLLGIVDFKIMDGEMLVEPFDLQINEEHFLVNGLINTREDGPSTLVLENQASRLSLIVPMLPCPIQQNLAPYHLEHPFYSKVTIRTPYRENEKALVDIQFRLDNNKALAHHFNYRGTYLKGRLINRPDGNLGFASKEEKGIHLEMKDIGTHYKGFKLTSPHTLITFSPKTGAWIDTKVAVTGLPKAISQWLGNDQFFFKDGKFKVSAELKAPLNDYPAIVIASALKMDIKDFQVYYEPADVAFPFDQLSLEKEAGNAAFKIVGNTLGRKYTYLIDGGLENFPSLLLDLVDQRPKSEVLIQANKLGWKDFIDLFGENGYLTKTEVEKTMTMKETIKGLQYNFQPQLQLLIDTLEYYDFIQLGNLQTGIHFENEHTLVLEKTSFNYEEGEVSLVARLDLSDAVYTPFDFELHATNINLQKLLPALNHFNIKLLSELEQQPESVSLYIKHQGVLNDQKGLLPNTSTGEIIFMIDGGQTLKGTVTYHSNVIADEPQTLTELAEVTKKEVRQSTLQTHLELTGLPHLFNNFFKTEKFFFSEGNFDLQADFQGDIKNLEELLEKGKVNFSLQDSKIYYQPGNVYFSTPQLDLDVKNNYAVFNLSLQNDSLQEPILFNGIIQNLSELVIGNTGKQINTAANIKANKLSWEGIQKLLVNSNNSSEKPPPTPAPKTSVNIGSDSITTSKKVRSLKKTLQGILTTFHPDLQVHIDTFNYSDQLFVEQLKTGIHLRDNNHLVLDQTGFQYRNGNVLLEGEIDISSEQQTPFDVHFDTDELNIAHLLEDVNYLALPSLQKMDHLSGNITMNLDLYGVLNQTGTALLPSKTRGTVKFELYDVTLEGFEPLEQMAAKLMMKKRFHELHLAPITNTFYIEGEEIHIPLTEIQSNAINVFIEGTLSYQDKTNIWASVPLKSVFFNDADVLEKKKGFATNPMKIHVEVTSDEAGENDFKIRMTRRKFYEQRNRIKDFKKERTQWRLKRKKQKELEKARKKMK